MIGRCRIADRFQKLNPIGEGTYGRVFRAQDKKTGEIVALKKVHLHKSTVGFPATALREIRILMGLHHPNIVELKEVVVEMRSKGADDNNKSSHSCTIAEGQDTSCSSRAHDLGTPRLHNSVENDESSNKRSLDDTKKKLVTYMVFEYCEHDLGSLLDHMKVPFSRPEVKCILLYLLKGVHILHQHNIIHRDIKLPNLFLTNRGELKIGDFGLARDYESPSEILTGDVVTMWYRAPELLFGLQRYTPAIDIWAVGCVMGELILGTPLLPGEDDIHQMKLICNLMGKPTSRIWPGVETLPKFADFTFPNNPYNNLPLRFPNETSECLDLLGRLLICDPCKRISARDALNHPYFSEHPRPKHPSAMPTWRSHRNEVALQQSQDSDSVPSRERKIQRTILQTNKKSIDGREISSIMKTLKRKTIFEKPLSHLRH